jgi:hypothetical protein
MIDPTERDFFVRLAVCFVVLDELYHSPDSPCRLPRSATASER